MLTIKCTFDEQTGRDGVDPLGALVISNERSRIVIEPTFFDSWLASLIEALPRLRNPGRVTIEIHEEPNPIEIEVASDGRLAISYKDQKTVAENTGDFESALRAAAGSFLAALKDAPETWQNRGIDPIRRFWATTQN